MCVSTGMLTCQPVDQNMLTSQLAYNFILHNIPFGFKIFSIAESYLITYLSKPSMLKFKLLI